jgi:hypothetical protein
MLSKAPLRKKRNFKNLTLENSPVVVSSPPEEEAPAPKVEQKRSNYTQLCEQLSGLEIGLELRLDLRPEDFKSIDELGRGNGGTVSKVLHIRTNTVMAKKVTFLKTR